ncbi:kinesin-like protein KIF20A isoform X2 [Rhodnius prolixus]|uniref:kinesin-like protein KIF20A isoform X2 n=1 Tax=Rhodnius prolixus TaxID=13249 RepID=UPI003D1893C1
MDSTRRLRTVLSYLESSSQDHHKEVHLPKTNVVRRIDFHGISEDDTIKVFLRIKPLNAEHITDEINSKHYKLNEKAFTSITSSGKAEIYNEYFFNGILPPTATQTEVFDLIVRPRLEEVLQGNDTLLFSYGTTGSGKTFTIQGKGSEPGIIPRVLYVIFASIDEYKDTYNYLCPSQSIGVSILTRTMVNKMEKEKESILELSQNIMLKIISKSGSVNDTIRATSCSEMEETLKNIECLRIEKDLVCLYSVWLSFIEVYNECIYDLFVNSAEKIPLKLAIDELKSSYVKGAKYICVSSWEEAYQLYLFGKHNLHVSPTTQNKNSSRSHCVFSIKIIKRPHQEDGTYYSVSSFTICDLAGAERQKKTRNYGARLKESQNINTSLLVLNRCFNVIRANQSRKEQDKQMVPFRESKLTQLFQHALLGNTGITMITNISQSDELTSETQQVLKSTAVAMKIKAKPFMKKVISKRKSIFADYCSTRIDDLHAITSDTDEGVGSSLGCNNCLEYKKEIELLQQSIAQKDVDIQELKESFKNRIEKIRTECWTKSTQILDETFRQNSARIEIIKEEHHKEMQELKKSYRELYEKKEKKQLSPIRPNVHSGEFSESLQSQKQYIQMKLLQLCDLFDIGTCQEEDDDEFNETEEILEKLIVAAQTRAANKVVIERQEQQINQLQAQITQLQKNIICTVENFGLDCKSKEDGNPVDHEDFLNRLCEAYSQAKAEVQERDKTIRQGWEEFKEQEANLKRLEAKVIKLEEEIAIKDHKTEELTRDVDNLSALLAAKSQEHYPIEQAEADACAAALGKLTLEDGSEQVIQYDKGFSAKKLRRRTTRRAKVNTSDGNSASESDDPSFFIPIQAATTGKKKRLGQDDLNWNYLLTPDILHQKKKH